MEFELKNAVGLKLRELRERVDTKIRVMQVGPVGFMGTADYDITRINVALKPDGFQFTTQTLMIDDKEFKIENVADRDFEEGIIERAWIG